MKHQSINIFINTHEEDKITYLISFRPLTSILSSNGSTYLYFVIKRAQLPLFCYQNGSNYLYFVIKRVHLPLFCYQTGPLTSILLSNGSTSSTVESISICVSISFGPLVIILTLLSFTFIISIVVVNLPASLRLIYPTPEIISLYYQVQCW